MDTHSKFRITFRDNPELKDILGSGEDGTEGAIVIKYTRQRTTEEDMEAVINEVIDVTDVDLDTLVEDIEDGADEDDTVSAETGVDSGIAVLIGPGDSEG